MTSRVSLVLEGELWDKHGFSQTLLLNSALEIVIIFSVLNICGIWKLTGSSYPHVVLFESHSYSKLFLFSDDT